MIKSMTVASRLRLLVIVALIASALVAVQGCYDLYVAMRVIKKNYDSTVQPQQDLNSISNLLAQSVLLLGQASSLDKVIRTTDQATRQDVYPALIKNISNQIDHKIESISNVWSSYAKTLATPDEKNIADGFSRAFTDTFKDQVQLSLAVNQTISPENIEQRFAKASLSLEAMNQSLGQLTGIQLNNMKISREQYENISSLYQKLIIGCIVFVCALMLVLLWMSRNINQTLLRKLGMTPEALNHYVAELIKSRSDHESLHLKNDKLDVKTAVNTLQENIARLLVDTQQIQYGINIGDLHTRANVLHHTKDYRKVLEIFNAILDQVMRHQSEVMSITAPVTTTPTQVKHEAVSQDLLHLCDELKQVLLAITQNETNQRIDIVSKSGDMQVLCQVMNTVIDALMPASTKDTLSELNDSSDLIKDFAQEAMLASRQLAQMNTSQLAALQYAANHMQYLAENIELNKNTTQQAHQLTLEILQSAQNEERELQAIATAIDSINKNTQKIQSQISIIDNIALQGDILAFNVAIEAARFGDEGRGFSVIATEVRNLSQRAISSTQTMKDLISDSFFMTGDGNQRLLQAESATQQILNTSHAAKEVTQSMITEAQRHASSLHELAQAGENLNSNGLQQAMLVEHQATQSVSLYKQAEILHTTVHPVSHTNQRIIASQATEDTVSMDDQETTPARKPDETFTIDHLEGAESESSPAQTTDASIEAERLLTPRLTPQSSTSKSKAAENDWILF